MVTDTGTVQMAIDTTTAIVAAGGASVLLGLLKSALAVILASIVQMLSTPEGQQGFGEVILFILGATKIKGWLDDRQIEIHATEVARVLNEIFVSPLKDRAEDGKLTTEEIKETTVKWRQMLTDRIKAQAPRLLNRLIATNLPKLQNRVVAALKNRTR